MRAVFSYHEVDDAEASVYGLSFKDVTELIEEHNEYFETNYQTISEFNRYEEHRVIAVDIVYDASQV